MKDEKILLETDKHYYVPVKGGHLDVIASPDPDYPGVDVEYIADEGPKDKRSRPRALIEKPNEEGKLRVLCWSDRDSEDWTEEIYLDSLEREG